jgi:hypothetical protein
MVTPGVLAGRVLRASLRGDGIAFRDEEDQPHIRQAATHASRTDMALYWSRRGDSEYTTRKHSRVCPKRKGMAMGMRRTWVGALVILAVLLWITAVPGHTDRGGHGYRGHGHKGHGHRGYGHRGYGHRGYGHGGSRVFINPRIVVPFGAYWRPYWEAYLYPPVVIAPPPRVYAQPSPPAQLPPVYWYYCDAAQAYYPYVQQCPGGWRPVAPRPP